MGSKKKKATMLYRMISTAGTGFFFVGEKSTKYATRKLALRKYDPFVNRYVLFTEQKLKKWALLIINRLILIRFFILFSLNMAKHLSAQEELEMLVPQSDPFYNDLKSIMPSGKLGGTPMVSQNGKYTISQFLCFSNGSENKYLSSYEAKKVPMDVMQQKLLTELRGINRDVI